MTRPTTDLSEILPELGVIAVVVLVSVVFHALLQRRVRPELLRKHNDVAGYLFSAVGVIYAVVLGFVVVVVWEKYDDTVANVEAEVSATADLYRTAAGLMEPARTQVRKGLSDYTSAMIAVEWPHMAQRINVERDVDTLERVAHAIDAYHPKAMGDSNAQQMSMAQIEKLFDARRKRLVELAPSVPLVLWFALVSGAIAMLTFTFFFGVENKPAQLLMTGMLAGLIAILFVVISEFDAPFSGSVSISSEGWSTLQTRLPDIP